MNSKLRNKIIEDLNKPRGDGLEVGLGSALHEKQLEVLKPLITGEKKLVFGACGRKFGKTRAVCYLAWRWALLNPNSSIYIVCPEGTHARRIYWMDARIHMFLDKDSQQYIAGKPNSRSLTINFKNGSNIQIMGSENYAAANGLTPNLVIYDEFKAFHPEFHTQMDPNRAAKAAPLFIIGTLAEEGMRNKSEYDALLEDCIENKEDAFVFKYNTYDNPINHLPNRKKAIEKQIALLRRQGKEHVVQREYFSKIIPGGETAIFPWFNEEKHVKKHEDILKEMGKDYSNMIWGVGIDPGHRTVFAGILVAYDPYNSKLYILDENYAKGQEATLISSFMAVLRSKMLALNPVGDLEYDWAKVCDEAALWAINETLAQFSDMSFMKSEKKKNRKEYGITLLNEAFQKDLIVISDKCVNLKNEIVKYHLNRQGNIPLINDHGIDALRYLIHHINFTIVPNNNWVSTNNKARELEEFDFYNGLF